MWWRRSAAVCSVLAVAWVVHPVVASAAPSLASVTPAYGVVGTSVTIAGSQLADAATVTFGGAAASFTVSSDGTTITATVPAAAVTGPVAVDDVSGPVFTVTRPVSLAVRAPATVTYPGVVTLVATLTAAGGAAVAGEPVELWAKSAGAPLWSRLAVASTGATGTVTFTHTPNRLTTYHVEHRAVPAYTAATASATVTVAPRITVSFPGAVSAGAASAITGVVTPARPGATVWLWRSTGTGWRSERAAVLDSAGRFRIAISWASAGSYVYKVVLPADATHVTGASAPGTVRVYASRLYARNLSSGMSGPDVLDLQRRLAAAHYDPGPLDGAYGYSTLHAVLAFEKVERLPRDGVAGQLTQQRLMRPTLPRPLHPVAGGSVEVDLTRQVLFYAVNGAVQRILDVSSGSGQYYYQNGVRYVAVTPVGSFRVFRKVNGIDVSPLGVLYRPAYFSGGYAIHGSDSVPTYPASHGCIRITNPAMDRLYDRLVIGTPVWVYRS